MIRPGGAAPAYRPQPALGGGTQGSRQGGTGSGGAQIFNVFGRILAGQTAQVGTCTDSVVVTITC